jgi:carboxymethylenebutenolidase
MMFSSALKTKYRKSPMSFNLTIPSHDGKSFGAYMARAAAARAPALIIIQEIFGVNAGLRQMCDEWAARGYHAICPDLFWRQEPGVEISDKTPQEWQKALALLGGFDLDNGIKDLISTLDVARRMDGGNGKAGTIGFCLGGKLAFYMAAKSDADCNVSYYGIELEKALGLVPAIAKPLLMHIAAEDKFVSRDEQMKIRAGVSANPRITAYVYEGVNHAFARVNGEHYDAGAAKLAEARTEEFLAKNLS